MSKEQYYNGIKRFVYRKFDELEVVKRNRGNNLYLRYKNDEYAEILIQKNIRIVYYNRKFSDKIFDVIHLEENDFEILLKRWVEDTFQMTVTDTRCGVTVYELMLLKIPLK